MRLVKGLDEKRQFERLVAHIPAQGYLVVDGFCNGIQGKVSLPDRSGTARGGEVVITKRGRVVARLIGDVPGDERPWLALRQRPVRWKGDPLAPAVDRGDIEALK